MKSLLFLLLLGSFFQCRAGDKIRPGAECIENYLPLIKGKRVGIFANQTSMVGNTHLVDTLKKLGVNVAVIFGPEHGFRGTADAGEHLDSYVDVQSGVRVISLYGNKRKPTAEDVKNIDVLLFDIQDVGARFYTYISSLEDFMDAACRLKKPLIVLDRPNPNGHYIDGPVMNKAKYGGFIGRQNIPVVYGMTIGEYASMLIGERWLTDAGNKSIDAWSLKKLAQGQFHFKVISNQHYDHTSMYHLPVRPSPNLPDMQSIWLYPSTCWFEGTVLSEGRGTDKPFRVFGHPSLPKNLYSFTPNPNEGAKSSKLYGQVCYGWDLSGTDQEVLEKVDSRIQLKWLLEAYRLFPEKDRFFIVPKSGNMDDCFFNKLAGNGEFRQQVIDGKSEAEIKQSWQPAIDKFRIIRKKYLLYKDFE